MKLIPKYIMIILFLNLLFSFICAALTTWQQYHPAQIFPKQMDCQLRLKGDTLYVYKDGKPIGCDIDSTGNHCIGDILAKQNE